MRCQYRGCPNEAVVDCLSWELAEALPEAKLLDEAELRRLVAQCTVFYCFDHCLELGYCWNCGIQDPLILQDGLVSGGLCDMCRFEER